MLQRTTALTLLLLCSLSTTSQAASGLTLGSYLWRTDVFGGGLNAPDYLGGYKIDLGSFDTQTESNSVIYLDWAHEAAY